MKKHHLKSQQESVELEQQAVHHASETNAELKFDSVEELLRHDAQEHPVPPSVAERLEKSLDQLPKTPAPVPWWKRILGS